MKKPITLLLLFLSLSGFCVTDTTGQKVFKINAFFSPEMPTKLTQIYFGEGMGYNLKKNYFNYSTGLNAQFPLTKTLSLGIGIAYTQQDLQATFYCMYCNTAGEPRTEKLELRFLETPLFIQYNLLNKKIKLSVQTGLQGSYLLNIPDLWLPSNLSYNKQLLKGFVGIGTSIDLGKHFSFQLTPTYRYAFHSLFKETHVRLHSIGIAGGISYRIRM